MMKDCRQLDFCRYVLWRRKRIAPKR